MVHFNTFLDADDEFRVIFKPKGWCFINVWNVWSESMGTGIEDFYFEESV